jgi:hypothetical protein
MFYLDRKNIYKYSNYYIKVHTSVRNKLYLVSFLEQLYAKLESIAIYFILVKAYF